MENLVYFSIAKYIPNVERNESINFGFSYYAPDSKELGYIPSTNNKRILDFDDETTLEEIEFLQSTLKYDFSEDSLTYLDDDILKFYGTTDEPHILSDKIYNYANIIQFDSIKPIVIEKNLKQTLKDIKEFYLYYDIAKKDRTNNKAKLFSVTNNTIKAYLDKDSYHKISPNRNTFYSKPFDFEAYLGNEVHYLKVVKFDYINKGDLFKELKALTADIIAYNCSSNPIKLTPKNYSLVINPTEFTAEHEKIAYELMSERARIFTLDKLPHFLTNSTNIF